VQRVSHLPVLALMAEPNLVRITAWLVKHRFSSDLDAERSSPRTSAQPGWLELLLPIQRQFLQEIGMGALRSPQEESRTGSGLDGASPRGWVKVLPEARLPGRQQAQCSDQLFASRAPAQGGGLAAAVQLVALALSP
jgi:hypothetical protein